MTSGLELQRLGMEPEPRNAQEVEGGLNPAAARGPDNLEISIMKPLFTMQVAVNTLQPHNNRNIRMRNVVTR